MNDPYEAYIRWIEDFVSAKPERHVRGFCAEATLQMAAAFPELRRAAGFVHGWWGRSTHWWCVTEDGTIVDPTAEQFAAVALYEEIDLTSEADRARIPTGRCMDCGDPVYEGKTFCSPTCAMATAIYLDGVRRPATG